VDPRSRIGAFLGYSSARGAKFRDVLASLASESPGGGSAQGLNRMGYRLGIRPFGIDGMTAPGIGAVPGRTSREA
jgi:hypothetical protein